MSTDEIDEFTKEALMDYFTASELVELLGVSVEDIILAFPEEMEEALEDLEEIAGLRRKDDDDF